MSEMRMSISEHPKNPPVKAVISIKLRTSVQSGMTAADFYDFLRFKLNSKIKFYIFT